MDIKRKVSGRRKGQVTLVTSVLYYRELAGRRMELFWSWLWQTLYFLNPYTLWRSDVVWTRCKLFYCAIRTRLGVDHGERESLLEWVKIRISTPNGRNSYGGICIPLPTNFTTSWKDGVALCALMESISPGSCPRFDLLNPEHCQSNVLMALKIAERHLKLKPSITVEDLVECKPGSDRRLHCLLSQLKITSTERKGSVSLDYSTCKPLIKPSASSADGDRSFGVDRECAAKGMGLMLAVKGRKASFNIYPKATTDLNIVIEIRGPNGTLASERITNRSPKKKIPMKAASTVLEKSYLATVGKNSTEEPIKIPFEYEVLPNKVRVSYVPLMTGKHRCSIIWQGQHIVGSPYVVSVDDSIDVPDKINPSSRRLLMPFRRTDSFETESANSTPPGTPTFGDSQCESCFHNVDQSNPKTMRKLGGVTKRKVLRRIMKVDGKEIVIEDSDEENLAAALQAIRREEPSNQNGKTLGRHPGWSRQQSTEDRHYLSRVDEGKCEAQDYQDSKNHTEQNDEKSSQEDTRSRAISVTESEMSSMDAPVNSNKDRPYDPAAMDLCGNFPWNVISEVKEQNLENLTKTEPEPVEEVYLFNNQPQEELETDFPLENQNMEPDFEDAVYCLPGQDGEQFVPVAENTSELTRNETEEWLMISVDDRTKEHHLTISDTSLPTDIFIQPTLNSELIDPGNVSEEEEQLIQYASSQDNTSSVVSRKLFFENLLTGEREDTKSPEMIPRLYSNSPVKHPQRTQSFPAIETSSKLHHQNRTSSSLSLSLTAIQRELEQQLKLEEELNKEVPQKETSTAFLQAKEFWEKSHLETQEEALLKSEPAKEIHIRSSVKEKMDYWQTVTGSPKKQSSKMTSPNHLSSESDGNTTPAKEVDSFKKTDYSHRLGSPGGSEGTQDSGVCLALKKDFRATSFVIRPRSLSDPGGRDHKEPIITKAVKPSNIENGSTLMVYRHNPLFSLDFGGFEAPMESSDDNSNSTAFASEMSDRGGYIDDEIPDYASIAMDRYVSFTGLLDNDRLLSRKELLGFGTKRIVGKNFGIKGRRSTDSIALLPRADQCCALGAGVYYGQVGLRNQFQVRTLGSGKGCLTVSVQGPGEHDVSEVILSYIGDHTYEVMYEVVEPGYYIISVKWSEFNIPDSPFICKVTY